MATYGLPSSHFPTKMARDDFVGKKFSIAGQVLVVAENDNATAYLTHESIKDLLENSLDATLQGGACNTKTDIVIIGDLDREGADYLETGKGAAIVKQVEMEKRKTELELVRFADFMKWSGAKADIQQSASVAQFDKSDAKWTAPGKERTRGKLFPRTLVASGGETSGAKKGLFAQFFKAA